MNRWLTYPAIFAVLIAPAISYSQQATSTVAQLQQQIDDQSTQIKQLDDEIAQYQVQLDETSSKKQTLQNTVTQLALSIKKTTAQVTKTKSQIKTTQLQIQELSHNIEGKQDSIDTNTDALKESVRRLDEVESKPLAQSMLSSGRISEAWEDAENISTLQAAVRDHITQLSKEKQSLDDTKKATEDKKTQLVHQQNTLLAQQGSLSATKNAQTDLLKETKNQESNFQSILEQKRAAKAAFEQALNNLQSKLQYAVDLSKVTPAGKGVLQWPLDVVRITQYFGNTPFAQSGAYNGKGHNGIDLAASIGTPVKAALTGQVIGTGNTDTARGCYSFGKWVMVKHGNGLNTMYAHLSQINVTSGQIVGTGEVIGYSGETGYATGPHLHFGVYVSAATQILRLGDATASKTPCADAVMPVVPLSGYLNPMSYL